MKKLNLSVLIIILSIARLFADGVQPVGSGTETDPYQIATLDNLLWISTNNTYWDKHFIQTADIDAADTQTWNGAAGFSPIGEYANMFSGFYNGDGHVIQNLYIWRHVQDYMGLFGFIHNSTIKKIGLTNAEVYGNAGVGSLVGFMINSTLENCFSTGIVGGQTGGAGGLIGFADQSNSISNCYSSASVTGPDDIGGLCGWFFNGSVTKCYSRGSVTGNTDVGGLLGSNNSATVTACFWDTETSGQATSAGGTGKTTDDMKDFYTYYHAGWDFMDEAINGSNDYWGMSPGENYGYPFLAWENKQNYYAAPAGNGTETNPYQINSLFDLEWLSEIHSVWDKHFIQTADIDAAYTQNWNSGAGFSPIGNSTTQFSGSYDGNNHVIQNLYINRPDEDHIGLFGETEEAIIENLGLTNAEVHGDMRVGCLVGESLSDTITNCYSAGNVIGWYEVGCFIGVSYISSITDCYSTGNVNGSSYVGGLIGSISSCSTLTNCYSTANVQGSDNIGGLIGMSLWCYVVNCYSSGIVTGYTRIGGLIGTSQCDDEVSYCYSTGSVNGTHSYIGGLIGEILNSITITACFWDTQTSGQATSAGGTGKTTAEMKNYGTYYNAGWDFMDESTNGTDNDWGINFIDNNGYPFLMWQGYDNLFQEPSGAGSISTPYLISNLNELAWISVITSTWSAHILQTADIDAADTQNWHEGAGFSPIGDYNNPFTGSYDGGNYSIDNLYINRTGTWYKGLFGKTSAATIENLGLSNLEMNGGSWSGGFVGYAMNTNISKCFVAGDVNGSDFTGSLVGRADDSTVENCFCTGNASGSLRTGGMIGQSYQTTTNNCYSMANVNGNNEVGGLIGHINNATVTNCYSTGYVDGISNSGGLVGSIVGSAVTASFWDTQTSGQSSSAAGTGKTTAEMRDYATFFDAGWDFLDETTNGSNDLWGINPVEHNGYPFLAWQGYINYPIGFPGGSGTEADPYQISSLPYLKWISENQTLWDKHFIQTADIDATDTQTWNSGTGFSPIGNYTDSFTGSYNGDGYLIQNLCISLSGMSFYSGLFGYAENASLENILIIDSNIDGYYDVGSLSGGVTNTTITNCFCSGEVQGALACGMLIGSSNLSTISDCYSSGTLQTINAHSVGGLIGNSIESSINNCYSMANIANGGYGIGGLLGRVENSTITDCYSTGIVAGTGDVGGLIGDNYNSTSTVIHCFWDIDTSGQSSSAGGTGKTTTEMKDYYTFYNAGWDFLNEITNGCEDNWGTNPNENDGYPFLSWQDYFHVLAPAGSGTEADPYQISNLLELGWLSIVQSAWDKYFIQTADIDAADTQNWDDGAGFISIGISTLKFTGSYNGAGHTIQNLYIYRPGTSSSNQGHALFAFTDNATIVNLGITDADITGGLAVAGLVGYPRETSIANCYTTGNITGRYHVGGLSGYNMITTITNCYSSAHINGIGNIGGLIGSSYEHSLFCSYSTGLVNGTEDTGGLIGYLYNSSYTTTACFWDTETSNQSTSSGGTGKTTSEMQDYYTFFDAGWDFLDETTNGSSDIWGINPSENDGYPFLSWQGYTHGMNLDAPTDVTISVAGNEVTLSWTEVAGATSYKIFATDTPDGTFTDVTDQGIFDVLPTDITSRNGARNTMSISDTKKQKDTRSTRIWVTTIAADKKLFYVKASN